MTLRMYEESDWKAFGAKQISHSVAHYLMAVDVLVREHNQCHAADIARHIAVSRNAVSLQLQSMRKNGLVTVHNRQIRLTGKGSDAVDRIVAMRRAFCFLLTELLDVDVVTAKRDSCKVEHLLSKQTGAQLLKLVKFIQSDEPHAQDFIHSLRHFKAHCSKQKECPICHSSCVINS